MVRADLGKSDILPLYRHSRLEEGIEYRTVNRSTARGQSMLYLMLLFVAGWAVVAGLACLSICAASARFNHEAERR
jgi:hypothetical protein